ncbi:hypothetical protein VT84_13130 [Gemmata sp. SH-PL17]|uniref:hypothetical protein n=1 Tax=Gemmata sp. SH-PL17 TaxID=1630693 RepID=UPI00078DD1AD|nr:hypothetical protein [Gemmata sp. SH-PL17]AMV25337.1 hypothetical protein VT84_13130 [Gemmata sp. SH-PL17]
MSIPSIFADFNNADPEGRVRLNCAGTIEDLARLGTRLANGLNVIVHDDELEANGEVLFSAEEHVWVAKIDWKAIRRLPVPEIAPRA